MMRNNRISFKAPALKPRLGIYVHVPFCVSKCSYCDFYSIIPNGKAVDEYINAVKKHLIEYANICTQYSVDTIYFGGGTPSAIGAKNIESILKTIRKSFAVSKNAEITCEVNPDSADKRFLSKIYKSGVNRLSIGIQSANDENLIMLGRRHNFETAQKTVEFAKKAKFSNISVDFMYGLQGQNLKDVIDELNEFIELDVQHISTYQLKLEEGTKMYKEAPILPDEDTSADMYLEISKRLKAFGFEHYEISNFAKASCQSQHNNKYWDLSEYLGIGPSAHSYLGGKRFYFDSDVSRYVNAIKNGDDIVVDEDEISYEERHCEYIMLKLRTTQGITETEFQNKFSAEFLKYEERMKPFLDTGHMTFKDGNYALTEQGFLISNTIISKIIDE